MRILVAIPHYFHPEPGARHSSVDERRRGERKGVVERVVSAWRHEFGGPHAMLNIEKKRFERVNQGLNEVTIAVMTTQDRSLIDKEFAKRHSINIVECKVDNPRMLGHESTRLFADSLHRFDLFVFSEDDLLVTDVSFVDKLRWFVDTFGHRRVLMPNRYEWNPAAAAHKVYVDGDIAPRAWSKWSAALPDEDFLSASALGAAVSFRRARNPHSGMHALTREQVDHWMRQPHWADRDVSFIGPLESAATLGVLKTFPIYKSWGRSFGFLGIEHLDRRFSRLTSRPAAPEPAPSDSVEATR